MSKSTPDDLAVAFRSIARRQREAIGDADPGTLGGALADVHEHVRSASALLGVPADAAAVADALDERPAADWDDATLDALRQHAFGVSDILRRISAMSGTDGDDEDGGATV